MRERKKKNRYMERESEKVKEIKSKKVKERGRDRESVGRRV